MVEHEAVLEAAIVPSPDDLRLYVPKAFITLRQEFTPDNALAQSIFAFARARLAPYKRVRIIEFSDLPKTISGKIRRVELRRQEQKRSGEIGNAMEFREEV